MASPDLPSTPRDTIRMFHYEEVIGEALFLELVRNEGDPAVRLKWAFLAQVETENIAWFRGPLLLFDLPLAASHDAIEAGRTLARTRFGSSWIENIRGMRDRLAHTHIPRFKRYLEQAEARCDPIEIAACRLMVDHDCAFQEFTERELAGCSLDHAIEPLRSMLKYPLYLVR